MHSTNIASAVTNFDIFLRGSNSYLHTPRRLWYWNFSVQQNF